VGHFSLFHFCFKVGDYINSRERLIFIVCSREYFMEVLLDTNFIISCLLKKIDFMGELEMLGFTVKLPREVFQEMKDLKKNKKVSHKEREAIDVAFVLLENQKKVTVGGRYADEGLIAKGKAGIYIATLDAEIKRQVPNKVMIDSARNGLRVVRD